mmetsp:Transcript_25713/g.39928  ORF Transcript_25713/g.39928 Transcript_25713/m.39928 type:complete len:409 (-) Transcript_25713:2322-3548(-)
MKPVIAIAALLPVASALRPRRRLQSSMSMVIDDSGIPLTDLPIPSPGFPPCNICGDGGEITNPDAVLQIPGITQNKTCAEYATDGQNGVISEKQCDLLPLVTTYVCDCQSPTDPVKPAPPVPPLNTCSCSPRDFTFQLQLDRNCDTDTIDGTPGIEKAVCNVRGGVGDIDLSTLEIVDIQFLEFGSGLEVINQNDTFTNTSLANGDTFSFPSISSMLNPDIPIEEQLQYFPTGLSLNMEGKVKDSDGNEVTVRNQVAWTYTESCSDLPISVGQGIGWVDIVGKEAPSPDFCPAAGPVPPTTTTEATTPSTTTTANVITTTSSSHSMITTTVPLFGKSGKSAKSKTLKDHQMAKVAKSVNDAKAEKVSKSGKSSEKSAKVTKAPTKSKSAKMFTPNSSMPVSASLDDDV